MQEIVPGAPPIVCEGLFDLCNISLALMCYCAICSTSAAGFPQLDLWTDKNYQERGARKLSISGLQNYHSARSVSY